MKLIVQDMSCQHCVKRINDTLRGLDGVEEVVIDLEQKLVEVSGTADVDAVINVIKSAGYTARVK
jgi:copper chaperone CopZ